MKTIKKSIELINKKKRIMVYYLAQILEAIGHLHSIHIIHRDLKVLNALLSHKTLYSDRTSGSGLLTSAQPKSHTLTCSPSKKYKGLTKLELMMMLPPLESHLSAQLTISALRPSNSIIVKKVIFGHLALSLTNFILTTCLLRVQTTWRFSKR
jgi:serine/threonine protein kinase